MSNVKIFERHLVPGSSNPRALISHEAHFPRHAPRLLRPEAERIRRWKRLPNMAMSVWIHYFETIIVIYLGNCLQFNINDDEISYLNEPVYERAIPVSDWRRRDLYSSDDHRLGRAFKLGTLLCRGRG